MSAVRLMLVMLLAITPGLGQTTLPFTGGSSSVNHLTTDSGTPLTTDAGVPLTP